MSQFLDDTPLVAMLGFVFLALAIVFVGGIVVGGAAERACERARRRRQSEYDRVATP